MRAPTGIETYRHLDHPLSQIRAALEFAGQIEAFVQDTWAELYNDEPPDEETLEEATDPLELLGTLASLGLRFEAETPRKPDPLDDDYDHFVKAYSGGFTETLLYAWAFKVMDALELDSRAFFQGIDNTDLLFVPDPNGTAQQAYDLFLQGLSAQANVRVRYEEWQELHKAHLLGEWSRSSGRRGAGPNSAKPVLIDRIALALRDAEGGPLTASELADRLGHGNVASIATALHQVVAYKKPKRIAGWIQKDDHGRYRWNGDDTAE